MSFINPLVAHPHPDVKEVLLKEFKGKPWTALPTPSFYVKESVIDSNCTNMMKRVELMGTRFRGHVKTHKCIEGSRKQLGYDLPNYTGKKHHSIVVSTFKEAWEIADYQNKTGDVFVKDVIYGLPNVTEESLIQIVELQKNFEKFTLMIDSLDHIHNIQAFNKSHGLKEAFNVIVKLDLGTHRAGILDTDYLVDVINTIVEDTQDIELYGFYVHSGHSYGSKTIEETELNLVEELEKVTKGFKLLAAVKPDYDLSKLIVSVGATPTIHSLEHHLFTKTNEKIAQIADEFKGKLELHAGNYPFCDLQQVSTGCVTEKAIAGGVIATVVSQYSSRNNKVGEQLTNAGVIAMSRETASKYPGFGWIEDSEEFGRWKIERLSQEHGVISPVDDTKAKFFPTGTKVKILPNHSCITANSFNVYYILNDEDIVVDVWIPWRGW